MLEMLKESKNEFKKYESTGNDICLQQAGEKLFSVFERYLEIKYQFIRYRHRDINYLASKNPRNLELLSQLETLHEYFYHGNIRMTPDVAKKIYVNVVGKIEERIKSLNEKESQNIKNL